LATPPASPATRPTEPPASSSPAPLAWRSVEAAKGPGSREDHTWTLQPDARAAWLFGGRDGPDAFEDLWRFDLGTDEWARIDPGAAGPDARFGHTATWVDGVGLVIWSGQAGSTFFDDLWAFDPDTGSWRELPAPDARPTARYGSCAALGPDDRLWVSHGFTSDGGRFDDTWAYDFEAGAWTDETPDGDRPVVRCLHDCLWTPDGRLVLYGGQTTGIPAIGDLWTRAADEGWTQGPEPSPAARQLYALAAVDGMAWVFGGGGDDGSKLDDLWALDLGTLAWRPLDPLGDPPAGRSGATLVADPERGRLLLFGGVDEDGASAGLWQLDGVT
jgi:N-acetylneuraminic acid mutarotase